MKYMRIMAFVAGLGASPALACGPDSDCMVGDRHYRIAMPEADTGDDKIGAIVFAHGYRGSAAGVMRNGSLRRMASDLGVALIAVKSEGPDWDIPNAPRKMESDGAEEFAYFDAVLDDATERFSLDPERIMATGFSAGGMMVWNLACARSDLFAGFAPISGTFWLAPPQTCAAPVKSIIHIHGDADQTVPILGRKIQDTKQGEVPDALAMYRAFGAFSKVGEAEYGRLDCEEEANAEGQMLKFCLFEGGHSFRTEFVRFAWEELERAGQL